ncbi:hypothetical protein MKX01_022415 [Papaver californicum]|nr:hypothetical protein MKX01_022415 [Papaver californicum]
MPKRCIHTWNGHTKNVNGFFPNQGHLLLSAGLDSKVRFGMFTREEEEYCKCNYQGKPLRRATWILFLLKDTIATKDKLNTTAGSYALQKSVVPRDAEVVDKLRKSSVVIFGKMGLSAYMRSFHNPKVWSARGGQGKKCWSVYMVCKICIFSGTPCGSSSGSAISVAANLVTVSLGAEMHGSILCPSSHNSVVGIKPTVGLTSRAGVIPVAPRQDTIGPICRTVSDAVYVLDAIVGFDQLDAEAIKAVKKFIPDGGLQAISQKKDGLSSKRIGIVSHPFFSFPHGRAGAVLVDNLEIEHIDIITNPSHSDELTLMKDDFTLYRLSISVSSSSSLVFKLPIVAFPIHRKPINRKSIHRIIVTNSLS